MEYSELHDAVFSLDAVHKRMLYDDLTRQYSRNVRMTQEMLNCQEHLEQYKKIMLDVLGNAFDDKILFSHSRIQPLPYARMIISKYLRDDGFSLQVIGKTIGYHHATVSFHIDAVELVLVNPKINIELANLEKRFRDELQKRK